MVNKPLIRPCFLVGVALGGAARIPLIYIYICCVYTALLPTSRAIRFGQCQLTCSPSIVSLDSNSLCAISLTPAGPGVGSGIDESGTRSTSVIAKTLPTKISFHTLKGFFLKLPLPLDSNLLSNV